MAHICSNCDKIFDHPGKYCSEQFLAWAPASTAADLAQKVGFYVGFAEAPAN